MTDVLVDTQKMVERLEAAGVPPAQARAHTELLAEAFSEHYASKEDLAKMEVRIDSRFEKMQASTDARFDKLEASTNARFDRLETSTNARFAILEQRITAESALLRTAIADTRTDLMKWVVTVGILQMALISALVLKLT